MYKTIVFFRDLQDGGRAYDIGDEYPRAGLTVSSERLEELSTRKNIRGIPLIRDFGENKPKAKPSKGPDPVAEPEPISEPEPAKEPAEEPVKEPKKPKTTKARKTKPKE